jgi:hypothetical protein
MYRDAIRPPETPPHSWGGTDLRAPAATVAAREPAGPRVVLLLRAGWQRLVAGARWLETCWFGDFLGATSLAALFLMLLFFAAVYD